jgi:hypothetical protein
MDERMINPYGACSHIGEKKDMKISTTTKVYASCFRDVIECMVGFRIDSRTTKRGTLKKIHLSSVIR